VSFAFQKVEPKGTPGVAQPDGTPPQSGGSSAGGGLSMLFPLLIMVPFLFLMFRRQKKEQQARSSLKKGDTVVSQSGLIGELMEMDEKVAKVKIAPGTTVKMLVTSISPMNAEADKKAADAEKDLKDLKDAKVAAEKK
jgi:preprotein translocase subunit YajC